MSAKYKPMELYKITKLEISGLEPHVENSSGHGVPSGSEGRARSFLERGLPRWGKPSGAAKDGN
ncbi:MAG: hypothetical protein Q8O36_08065, partial [Candidatus Omnitrophota bacterium]|nr:hypothetical protein [Candidatus Omnitrophota bacterium]